MKNIAIITGLLVVLLGAGGCEEELLETQPTDKYNEGNFWESEAAVEAALSGCYNPLTADGLFGGDATPLWEETATPNAYNYSNAMGFNLIAEGRQQSSNGGIIAQRWHDSYVGIGRCNTFLANVDRVEMSEDIKTRMKGEAHFLRGLYYFMLENYYGGVPLILDEPNPDTQSDLSRTPREEVVAQIIQDLDSAALVLPLNYSGGNVGRATKGAALALKARVLLYEASPLFNPSNDITKWQAAADAAKAVMDLSEAGYGLYDDYRELFMPQNENNKEVIFDVQYIFPGLGTSFDLIGKQYNTNAPLLGLAQAYDMKNGLPASDPLSGYNEEEPYANRDPRLYATIFYPGDTLMEQVVDEDRFAVTGFGMQKYTIYDEGPAPAGMSDLKSGQSETNYIILRYADVLLMYAEAMNEFSGPSPAVYDALNKVRQRPSVNMPEIVPPHTQEELREIIRHERRIEFAGEGYYYNDIRRWKTAEDVLNAPIYTYNGSQIEVRTFNPARDYLWPIPLTETDLNPNLEQNPNY
ncbi:RagB/SusD family nutrient uptake outer membrane protein [Pontibacter sp. 172403-2]|uniref:RagB/SusD family nutrient uptake outer membrane protein n=1 Tax=Pontibacter rufus TaxID=2791028 RepID=UPI0018AFE27B|nr:RagB/SusD family nutrient uptake outer membrane protein [Pontibacter sp. 172403-2]MBF9255450.1 RagB/SusD family nutrient uptake outer membrane protein [Pontibacter sp. 172403-2]